MENIVDIIRSTYPYSEGDISDICLCIFYKF
jgi:hypothetical protein